MEAKGKDKNTFLIVEGTPLFFKFRDGPYFPTLRLLHQCKYPFRSRRSKGDRWLRESIYSYSEFIFPPHRV